MRAAERLVDDAVDRRPAPAGPARSSSSPRRHRRPCRRCATGSTRSLRAKSPNRRHVRTSARGWPRPSRPRRPIRPRRRPPRPAARRAPRHCSVERAIASACPRSSACTPGKGARRIDQRHHRQAEAVGQLHQADRLAIALGLGHAEIMLQPARGIVALFVPDQHHRRPSIRASPPMIARIVAEGAVARQRQEIVGQAGDIMFEVRPVRDGARPGSSATASAWHRYRAAACRTWPRAWRPRRRCRSSPIAGGLAQLPRSAFRARRSAFRNRDRSACGARVGRSWRRRQRSHALPPADGAR